MRTVETPIRALWNSVVLLVVMFIVGAVVACGVAAVRYDAAWTSSAVVRVGRPPAKGVLGDAYTDPAYVERVLRTVQRITDDSDLETEAARTAKLPQSEIDRAGGLVAVAEVPESELLTYTVHTETKEQSRAFLDAVVDSARSRVKSTYGDAIIVSVPAIVGPTKTSRGLARAALIGGFAALLLGVAFVLLRNELRRDPVTRRRQ